jgi:hypothetical protein
VSDTALTRHWHVTDKCESILMPCPHIQLLAEVSHAREQCRTTLRCRLYRFLDVNIQFNCRRIIMKWLLILFKLQPKQKSSVLSLPTAVTSVSFTFRFLQWLSYSAMFNHRSDTFDVLKAIMISNVLFWIVTPCSLIGGYGRFGGVYLLHF